MTGPQYKPGDFVNGHVLAVQPDGSQVWLPVGAEQRKPGDIANGHRLTQQPDGALVWLPIEADPTTKRKAWPWVVGGLAVLVLLSLIIPSAVTSRQRADSVSVSAGDTAWDKEQAREEPAAEPDPKKVEKLAVPNVIGMEASTAVAALRVAGFEVADAADPAAIVTATTPSRGGIAEKGSTVTMVVEPPKPKLSLAQENALEQAQSYLNYSSFSRQGLIDQMSSEYGSGYPVDVATWAVDYLNVDWNAQAAEQARSYLEYSSFSRDGLFEQLTSEYGSQFTAEQANAGLAAVGY